MKRMTGDGACLFRAIADQVYGDQELHDMVRKNCMDHIGRSRDHFSQYVTEDFDEYIARKRRLDTFGNHLEIQACTEIYNRPIEVYSTETGEAPLNIFDPPEITAEPQYPIRLSYHNGNHYNSVVDPNNPSVGVGLGLPQLVPGLADKTQLLQAKRESEVAELEQEILRRTAEESELTIAQQALEREAIEASIREAEAAQYSHLDAEDDLLQQALQASIEASFRKP
jgi:OTU domain-containing protein 5